MCVHCACVYAYVGRAKCSPAQLEHNRTVLVEYTQQTEASKHTILWQPQAGHLSHVPSLTAYIKRPLLVWRPELIYPVTVPFYPCKHTNCNKQTTPKGWASHGPKLVQDLDDIFYLMYYTYTCPTHGDFSGTMSHMTYHSTLCVCVCACIT
jgi:hypothetical protein